MPLFPWEMSDAELEALAAAEPPEEARQFDDEA